MYPVYILLYLLWTSCMGTEETSITSQTMNTKAKTTIMQTISKKEEKNITPYLFTEATIILGTTPKEEKSTTLQTISNVIKGTTMGIKLRQRAKTEGEVKKDESTTSLRTTTSAKEIVKTRDNEEEPKITTLQSTSKGIKITTIGTRATEAAKAEEVEEKRKESTITALRITTTVEETVKLGTNEKETNIITLQSPSTIKRTTMETKARNAAQARQGGEGEDESTTLTTLTTLQTTTIAEKTTESETLSTALSTEADEDNITEETRPPFSERYIRCYKCFPCNKITSDTNICLIIGGGCVVSRPTPEILDEMGVPAQLWRSCYSPNDGIKESCDDIKEKGAGVCEFCYTDLCNTMSYGYENDPELQSGVLLHCVYSAVLVGSLVSFFFNY